MLTVSLIIGTLAAIALWTGLSIYVLSVHRLRTATRRILADALEALEHADLMTLGAEARAARLAALLAGASRDLLMSALGGREIPDHLFAPLFQHLLTTWGRDGLVANASAHRTSRDKWRRITALRILVRANDRDALDLLARAVGQSDIDVADAALGLLGRSDSPRALDLLFAALRTQRHPAARVAAHIEHSPQPVVDRLRALLSDPDPVCRLWGATLLAREPDPTLEREIAALTADADPRVRKAAIQTLGKIGDEIGASCAFTLLKDAYPYVRAHAARALGELGREDQAEAVAALLGDGNWWVRHAAKESLEMMGSDIWPVLMRCLNHSDRFIRNGAAEVFQNLGVLDSLIVMEAASDDPAPLKIAMLQRIVNAGGVQFTDSLVERAGPILGPRIRQMVATVGLEHVGAH